MTLPSRKKHRTTARTVASRLLVGALSFSFLFPAFPQNASFAAEDWITGDTPLTSHLEADAASDSAMDGEPEFGFERGEWKNRTQPTWINNAPDGSDIRDSSMLDWGPNPKPISLSQPQNGANKPIIATSPLVSASEVPASIVGKRQGARRPPENIRLSLNPATGKAGQKYTAVSLLQPKYYTEPNQPSADPTLEVQTVGFTTGMDFQLEQKRAADEARRILDEKVRVLQARAQSRLLRSASRASNVRSSTRDSIAFRAPTPPIASYSPDKPQVKRSNHQVSGGGDFYQQPAAPSQAPGLLNEPPSFSAQDLNDLQRVRPDAQQSANGDPFGQDNQYQQPSTQPSASPSLQQSGAGDSSTRPFRELFQDPSGNSSDGDLEAELKRLEDKSGEVDSDLEKELRDLGLDDEEPDDESLSPENQGDVDPDLPTRRGDDEPDGKSFSDCGRIYDDRDCCLEDKECQNAFDKLKTNSLASLSLDISPSFDPSEEDPNELLRRKTEKLMSAPSRSWIDRTGNVVANGSLEDFRYGRVYVRGDSGETVSIDYRELSRDDLCFVNSWWQLPAECPLGNEPLEIRNWTMTTFTWKAAGTCHKPLYFEHLELERYGHSAGPVLQPVLSGAHFFANVILLPYNSGIHPPTECLYDLGNYRPGDCAPWLIPAFPLQKRANVFETALGLGLWGLF